MLGLWLGVVLEIGLGLKTKHSVTESILANARTGGRSVEMHPGDDFGPRTALEFSKKYYYYY